MGLDPIECGRLTTQVSYDKKKLPSDLDHDEDYEHADELLCGGFLCRNSLVMQTKCCSSCLGVWSQAIMEVNVLDLEIMGLLM